MTAPRLVAFDLDDTLAPSKSSLDPRMLETFAALLETVPVAVISGGNFQQFEQQLVTPLSHRAGLTLDDLHLLPTCGTRYYRWAGDDWALQYAEDLTDDEKARALAAVEAVAKDAGYWESETWGDILEDRGSQITFSALGQAAPVDVKKQWDPTGAKKDDLRRRVQAELPDLEVRSGGSTSVDITRKGIDKAYGMQRLAEITGIALDDMLFVGDRLDPEGNDYPVKALGVPCHAVEGWEDTDAFLTELIPTLRAASA
ncbi:HAD family hydrolase [Curtobacterium sp. MMLR14_010]|uniref:HAD-IIB family hydrolase n=1 Tax=Curtobacterium sp. MMLR14_010 TaxID=1898743 RepID=UPI0008DE8D85|nr:HAD-IIB family hydrolase [Curtobacterium sp. MMLR14_010]OII29616.1 HAD family hydrolase [Curtobacterium sp. MMLR14_010]